MRFNLKEWSEWPRQSKFYGAENNRRHMRLFVHLKVRNPYHRREAGKRFCKEHGL